MKCCSKCGETKPFDEFGKRARSSDGLQTWCKPCMRATVLKWQKENPERTRERCRKWAQDNPEAAKAWVAANPDKVRAKAERYRSQNVDKERERCTRYNRENREKRRAARLDWERRNPAAVRARWARRRAAKLRAVPAWADQEKIAEMYSLAEFLRGVIGDCHVDHIVPLQHPLVCGLHVHHNLRVVPAEVNLAKYNRFDESLACDPSI